MTDFYGQVRIWGWGGDGGLPPVLRPKFLPPLRLHCAMLPKSYLVPPPPYTNPGSAPDGNKELSSPQSFLNVLIYQIT